MIIMKKIIYFFVAIISLFIFGCQPTVTEERAKQIIEEITIIPIDYDGVVGKASTTKNFYFIFDQSGSMSESCSGERKIDGAKTAITKFMENVPSDVNIGLMVIGCDNNSQISELLPLASASPKQKELFNKHIMDTEPTNGTPLVQAIKLAVDKMVSQKKLQLGYGEYRIIIVTDGNATDGEIEDAAIYAMQYAIGIYSIGLCMGESHPLKQFSVKYYDAENYDQLKSSLDSVTAETEMFDANNYDSSIYK